tara:strand:- start:256 stop:486 length:231 start_codon:yes stop_codon:yes gene_type:complete
MTPLKVKLANVLTAEEALRIIGSGQDCISLIRHEFVNRDNEGAIIGFMALLEAARMRLQNDADDTVVMDCATEDPA